jgi:4'-phosphopantetheinyl transferase
MGENKLYYLNVEGFSDPELFALWYDRMDEERKAKIDRYKNDSDKYLSLGAGTVLKLALKSLGMINCAIEYREGQKPVIKGEKDMFFNLSHSGKMAVLALSDKEVGVDVELNRKFSDHLIKYVFDEDEIRLGEELFSEGKEGVYPGFWTAKESVMKYFGVGIGMDPKKIHLSMAKESDADYWCFEGYMKVEAAEYSCDELIISRYSVGDYQISVCSQDKNFGSPIELKI